MSPASVPRWLPNFVTAIRISLIPAFLLVAGQARATAAAGGSPERLQWLAFGVLLALGLSDLLDGWLARRFGLESQLGAILDAFADKLAQVVLLGFFSLTEGAPFGSLPLWLFLAALARDLFLGSTWLVTHLRGTPVLVVHRAHGKASSALVFGLLLWATAGVAQGALPSASVVVAVAVVLSTLRYVQEGLSRHRGASD